MIKLIFKIILIIGLIWLVKSLFPAQTLVEHTQWQNPATVTAPSPAKQTQTNNSSTSCQTNDLSLSWPLKGKPNQDWVVNNYEDLDSGPGIKDFSGAIGKLARTYNGHKGIDIDVPTFKWTNENFPVVAAADGIVTRVVFAHPDRNLVKNIHSKNNPKWNFVELKHSNGYYTIYGHLKQHTGYVNVGDQVSQGQGLGVVASSGKSTWPHLHFEVRDCDYNAINTSVKKLWQNAPQYQTPFDLMEVVIRSGKPPNDATRFIIDGKPNQLKHTAGKDVTVATILAGGQSGDKIEVVVKASGRVYQEFKKIFEQSYRKSFWFWYFTLPKNYTGSIRIDVKLNGLIQRTEYLRLSKQ